MNGLLAVQPLGLHLDQLLYGMWFIAGTVAYFIIRKPGVALLAEIAAASGEFLWVRLGGLTVLLSGGTGVVCGISVHGFPLQTLRFDPEGCRFGSFGILCGFAFGGCFERADR